jgi:hypothetical protein
MISTLDLLTFVALKEGDAFTTSGGSTSYKPPVGAAMFAHAQKIIKLPNEKRILLKTL